MIENYCLYSYSNELHNLYSFNCSTVCSCSKQNNRVCNRFQQPGLSNFTSSCRWALFQSDVHFGELSKAVWSLRVLPSSAFSSTTPWIVLLSLSLHCLDYIYFTNSQLILGAFFRHISKTHTKIGHSESRTRWRLNMLK